MLLAHHQPYVPLIARGLEIVAFTATMRGRPDIAAHMFGAVEALRERTSVLMPLAYQQLYEQAVAGSAPRWATTFSRRATRKAGR